MKHAAFNSNLSSNIIKVPLIFSITFCLFTIIIFIYNNNFNNVYINYNIIIFQLKWLIIYEELYINVNDLIYI